MKSLCFSFRALADVYEISAHKFQLKTLSNTAFYFLKGDSYICKKVAVIMGSDSDWVVVINW